jgi:nitroimidazol reductase NimA-like FMN-containing flavoprotein (pyridoxamine 5'-phosphate oxidase superfamily)
MTKDIQKQSLNKIRRSDRAKDDAWIRSFLQWGEAGTLATSVGNQPFLVTRNYAFDAEQHAIYLHGAMKGRTFENVQANPRVCFSVSEMGRLLPDQEAMEFGVEYAGVVVFGTATVVDNADEATHGLQWLMKKYFPHLEPGVDYEPVKPETLKDTAVYRIDIESWSGKEKRAKDDFPGAFYFKDLKREA